MELSYEMCRKRACARDEHTDVESERHDQDVSSVKPAGGIQSSTPPIIPPEAMFTDDDLVLIAFAIAEWERSSVHAGGSRNYQEEHRIESVKGKLNQLISDRAPQGHEDLASPPTG